MVISENRRYLLVLKHKEVQTIIALFFSPVRCRRNTDDKVTEFFFMVDEFCKFFVRITKK